MTVNHKFKGLEDFCSSIDGLIKHYIDEQVYISHTVFFNGNVLRAVFKIE
jgi:hypothetical protein